MAQIREKKKFEITFFKLQIKIFKNKIQRGLHYIPSVEHNKIVYLLSNV